MHISNIKIQAWNIFGVFKKINGFQYSKLCDPDFLGHIKNFQIFGLIETHHTDEDIDKMQIFGYKCFQTCRKKLKFGRKHGGLAIYVKNTILPGIKKLPLPGSETIILKLKAEFFNLSRDLLVSFSYCAPAGSSYLARTQFDPWADLEQKLTNVADQGDLVCLGDFNARSGTELDYLDNEDNTDIPVTHDFYTTDTTATYPRGNKDTETNQYGEQLIALCRSVPLRVCNGRKMGDILGEYTCYKWNGQSVVDYCLASPGIYDKISSFTVHDFIPQLSDHCSVSLTILTDFHFHHQTTSQMHLLEKPVKLNWSKKIEANFENIIQSSDAQIFLANFAQNEINADQNSIDNATETFTDFLISCAKKADDEKLKLECKAMKKSPLPNWKFKRKPMRIKQPNWHDNSCEELKKKLRHTSLLLKKFPKNPFLLGRLNSEQKQYKRLLKSKHKEYINKMFTELDQLYDSNPRGYMNLVKSLRTGSFDKKVSDDSSYVTPDRWQQHFTELLGPPVSPTPAELDMKAYVLENSDSVRSELDNPITRSEIIEEISSLKNNKAVSFDRVSNEILKAGKLVLANSLLKLFNPILSSTFYPSNWKHDILSPLHKSGEKSDPNNYRGLAVSSCLGKLFNKILQRRLDKYCKKFNHISILQGSGKAGSRTSDHLLILRCLFDKYVKHQGKHLFTCFVDLRKAYDTVPRTQLFYTLLRDYSIGGNFLKILQQIYNDNKIFVKLSEGLVQPFKTTVGVKQGCVFSPILFNLFINKICSIFDTNCDPVQLNNLKVNCLLWADDLLLVSKTASGLQNSINKIHQFYNSMGLDVNIKKTKVMVMNKRGKKLDKIYEFTLGNKKIEITDEYQYLGIKLRPSGSFTQAVQELNDKASRAWFGISNIIFRNKRMQIDRIFRLFDSLITPIATYGSSIWLPFNIPKKCFESREKMIDFWENLKCEILNQKCAKITLSVNQKTPRLAVLGELGRYPILLQSLSQCMNYKLSLFSRMGTNPLIGHVIREMQAVNRANGDTWLSRVENIDKVLKTPQNLFFNNSSGKKILKSLKSKFDLHFLNKINEFKHSNTDSFDHNKLRTYKTFKSSFTREPYLDLVRNRNQRCFLSRLRVSSHKLNIELGRHTRPITPSDQRYCKYCWSVPQPHHTPLATAPPQTPSARTAYPAIDDEFHFLIRCPVFSSDRNCVFTRLSQITPNFPNLSDADKFKTLLCPTTAFSTKLVHRFIKQMFATRDKYDGVNQINQ